MLATTSILHMKYQWIEVERRDVIKEYKFKLELILASVDGFKT